MGIKVKQPQVLFIQGAVVALLLLSQPKILIQKLII